jgi:o-succinylbenzoate---CoA ligase
MEQPLAYLQQRSLDDWLLGGDSQAFATIAQQLYEELIKHIDQQSSCPKILLVEIDPVRFLAGFMAATAAKCPVFLGNPNWMAAEWRQVWELVQPDLVWGDRASLSSVEVEKCPSQSIAQPGWIMIPTGGSSGQISFAIHTWQTLMASVQGFQQYFQQTVVNAYCVLPLYHVSGLMQFMRAFTSGGRLAIQPFKQLEPGKILPFAPADGFISLVPTQLQRLLANPEMVRWLAEFKTVLLGGAPAWPELLAVARRDRLPLAPTYGMTETASQVATLKPQHFLAGQENSGQVLPHAQIQIQDSTGHSLPTGELGRISIRANSLALGYYPHCFEQDDFQPDDLGYLDTQGYLHVVGRNSRKIITGGENVFPTEVETAIRATGLVADVYVIGTADAQWGQVVTAVYVPRTELVTETDLQTALKQQLSRFKQPKQWIRVECLPRNLQGKVNYEQEHAIAMQALRCQSSG